MYGGKPLLHGFFCKEGGFFVKNGKKIKKKRKPA
jgi:hypothetical protein